MTDTPNALHPIWVELLIAADNDQLFRERLHGDEAVEGILVVVRQPTQPLAMRQRDRQQRYARLRHPPFELPSPAFSRIELAKIDLYPDLPQGSCTSRAARPLILHQPRLMPAGAVAPRPRRAHY